MKRSIFSLASLMLLSAGSAHAQSSVTLFGIVDTGVEYLDNIGAAGDSVTRMPTVAGSLASRWGMRGSEDLGGGLKASFVLESGFGTDSGVTQQSTGSLTRIFGRQAYVGLSGDWGQISLGRQYAGVFYVQLKTDPFLASIYGDGAFDLFLAAPRVDNSIAYGGKFGGVSVNAVYSLGRTAGDGAAACPGEAAGDGDNCNQWSLGLFYDGAGWGVGGSADVQKSTVSTAVTRLTLNGYYMLGKTKLMANYLDVDNDINNTQQQLWSLGVMHPITDKVTFEAAYYSFKQEGANLDASMLVLSGKYNFSKRTAAYLMVGHMMNDGASNRSPTIAAGALAPRAGEDQTGVMVGLRHSF